MGNGRCEMREEASQLYSPQPSGPAFEGKGKRELQFSGAWGRTGKIGRNDAAGTQHSRDGAVVPCSHINCLVKM